MKAAAAKDPVENYEKWLLAEGILTETAKHSIRETIKAAIEAGLQEADAEPMPVADIQEEIADMYAPVAQVAGSSSLVSGSKAEEPATSNQQPATRDIRFIDAIQEAFKRVISRK